MFTPNGGRSLAIVEHSQLPKHVPGIHRAQPVAHLRRLCFALCTSIDRI